MAAIIAMQKGPWLWLILTLQSLRCSVENWEVARSRLMGSPMDNNPLSTHHLRVQHQHHSRDASALQVHCSGTASRPLLASGPDFRSPQPAASVRSKQCGTKDALGWLGVKARGQGPCTLSPRPLQNVWHHTRHTESENIAHSPSLLTLDSPTL